MIQSHVKELKNTQVKYKFPIRVGDIVPALLTTPASAPTTSPVRFAISVGHRNPSSYSSEQESATHMAWANLKTPAFGLSRDVATTVILGLAPPGADGICNDSVIKYQCLVT